MPDSSDVLEVSLLADGHPPARAGLVDVTVEGAGLRFAPANAPSLALGCAVVVHIGAGGEEPLDIAATVQFRREEAEARRYGIRFDNPDEVAERLTPALARLFNRRAAFRVTPDAAEPIVVTIEAFDPTGRLARVVAPMVDLSVTGMGVDVAPHVERDFCTTVAVRLSFDLPTFEESLNLGALIHHRKLAGDAVHYGIGFDPDRTSNYSRQRRAIMDYVVARYRAERVKR